MINGYNYSMSDDDKLSVYVTWSTEVMQNAAEQYAYSNQHCYQVIDGELVGLDTAVQAMHRYAISRALAENNSAAQTIYYTLTE